MPRVTIVHNLTKWRCRLTWQRQEIISVVVKTFLDWKSCLKWQRRKTAVCQRKENFAHLWHEDLRKDFWANYRQITSCFLFLSAMVCSLKETLALRCWSMQSKVFFKWTEYTRRNVTSMQSDHRKMTLLPIDSRRERRILSVLRLYSGCLIFVLPPVFCSI